MDLRIGHGYDIHKLVKNRKLILGNVTIPYFKGFEAHSDGDVLIHSIIDALLGASNLGDIGQLFPDTDKKYKDIDSRLLLQKVLKKIKNKGLSIVNIDTTIICQKPKLSEYIMNIKKRLSEILKISIDTISVKAKSKEELDSTGKGKSIEVFCSCLLKYY